jgi:hypothetical protein
MVPTYWFNLSDSSIGKVVKHIFEDSGGDIYVVSELGISLVKGNEVTLLARGGDVVEMVQKGDSLYFACHDNVLVMDRNTRSQKRIDMKHLGAGYVTSMTMTGRNEDFIYVGMSDNAVAVIDTRTMVPRICRHDMGRVRYLFPDPEGLLWIATDRTGIWS